MFTVMCIDPYKRRHWEPLETSQLLAVGYAVVYAQPHALAILQSKKYKFTTAY